ncbi:MAG: hypothetical protein ABSG81_13130 [Acidimicrobiales bacterium]
MAVAAGAGGAFAGCHPTGTRVVDPIYTGVFAALITYLASRAGRETLLVFSAVAVVMSRSWLDIPAAIALLIAFTAVFPEHSRRRVGGVVGALGVQAVLRWPPIAFHGSTALVATAVVAPLFVSGFRRMSSREKRRTKRTVAPRPLRNSAPPAQTSREPRPRWVAGGRW